MRIRFLVIVLYILCYPVFSHAQDTTQPKVKGLFRKRVAADIEAATNHAAHGAVLGAVKGLKDARFQQLLDSIVDTLLVHVGKATALDVATIRDTLLSNKTIQRLDLLRDSVLGNGLSRKLQQLMDTLLGQSMLLKTRALVRSSIDEALSAKTQAEVANLIDTLGKTGSRQINLIADSILTKLNGEVKNLSGQYQTDAKDFEAKANKLAIWLYIVLGFIVLILGALAYVYYLKIRLEKLSGILTYQIHQTKNNEVFNDLKTRISNHAKREGLEPMLRDLLKSKGMLGDATRQSVTGTKSEN